MFRVYLLFRSDAIVRQVLQFCCEPSFALFESALMHVKLNRHPNRRSFNSTWAHKRPFLQSVLNAATRLVFSANRYAHTTPLLQELYWLRVSKRIQFRLCVLTYRCLNGTAPQYLTNVSSRTTAGSALLNHLCWYRRHAAQ